MLDAGHAEKALAQRATATVNCRILPGTGPAAVMAELERVAALHGLQIAPKHEVSSSPASPLCADVLVALRRAVEAQHPELPILPYMSPGATDSTHFRAVGIDSYGVAGFFMRLTDDFSHGLNERVPATAIPGGLVFWDALLRALVDPGAPGPD